MNREIAIIREVVVKVTQLLAGKGLSVTQQGAQAFVQTDKNGKPVRVNIPHIPDNATPQLLMAIQGFIDHEVAHILFTEFTYKAKERKANPELHQLHNLVEDPLIEKLMAAKFPGAHYNLGKLQGFFLEKITEPELVKVKGDPEKEFGVILVPAVRALTGQKVFQEWMDKNDYWKHPLIADFVKNMPKASLDALKTMKNTRDSFAIADVMYGVMHPPKPPAPPAPAPAPPSGESTSGKSEEKTKSDGEGSNKEKPEDEDDKGSGGEKSESDEKSEMTGEPDEKEGKAPKEKKPEKEKAEKEDEPNDEEAADDGESDGNGEEQSDEDPADAGGSEVGEREPGESDDGDGAGEDPEGDGDADDGAGDTGESEDGDGSAGAGKAPSDSSDEGEDGDAGAGGEPGDEGSELGEADPDEKAKPGAGSSIFSEMDIKLENKDFSDALQGEITKAATESTIHDSYRIFTKDFDKIEVYRGDAVTDAQFTAFDDQTRHMVGPMQKEIERLMAARSLSTRVPGYRSGRLHAPSLHRLSSGDNRVFARKTEAVTKDTAVCLLIDNSGSMNGSKMEIAMNAAYALSQTLDRVNITHEAIGFTTGHNDGLKESLIEAEENRLGIGFSRIEPLYMPIYKGFDERMNPAIKRRFAAAHENQSFLRNNVDGECVEIAAQRLMQRKESRKVLIVLSDGQPAAAISNYRHAKSQNLNGHLKKVVKDATKRGIEVIGIGIKSSAVESFYEKRVVLNDIEKLPSTVMGELKRILTK